jgi:hypothetical protein
VHRVFNISKDEGLAEYFLGDLTKEQIIKKTEYANVDVITRGGEIYNSSLVLVSDKFKELTGTVASSQEQTMYIYMNKDYEHPFSQTTVTEENNYGYTFISGSSITDKKSGKIYADKIISAMLGVNMSTTIDDVEMTMNLSYFNEASVENLSGNVSLDDYVNYMFLKQCSKNTKQTGTFTFEASGTLDLDYNCDDEDELFCEAKPISGLHVKGSGKLVPFPQSSSRLWNTENVVFDEGDKNKISLIQQFIYSPYINPIALSTFSRYLSGDAKYIYKYNFSETEITVDIKEILDINDNKSTIKAVFDKEGYIKSYHLENQKGQNTTYVIDINYHFE